MINQGNGSRRECADAGIYGYTYPEYPEVGFNWGGFKGPITPGYWGFYVDEELKAKFDFASVYPFDANDKPLVYVPSVKISIDETNQKVNRVEVELYLFRDDQYVKVTDPTAFKKIASSVGFSFTQADGSAGQIEDYREIEKTFQEQTLQIDLAQFNHEWHYADSNSVNLDSGKRLDKIAFQYEIYGISYRFEFRRKLEQ